MWCCLFLIPLQPSSPSIMPPSGRVHPPTCLIGTFCRVSFACGRLDHSCISNVVICPTCIQTSGSFKVSLCLHYVSLPILVLTSHSVHAPTHLDEIDWCWEINLHVVQGDKGLVYFYDRNDRGGGGAVSVGIRGSILYVHKRNERIVPTLVLFQSISRPRDEIEREWVGACVIPKADSKFWTGDHSIRKSYINGIQCSFHFWTYNILPPILSTPSFHLYWA